MSSAKALLGGWLGRFVFREAEVSAVEEPTEHFRKLTLRGAALRDVAWSAGSKLQIFLPEIGMRTYTPLNWDRAEGSTQLLVYLHGTSPGASWARSARVGASVKLFGPRRSLDASSLPSSILLVGDETSFGVAHALDNQLGADQVRCVFEVHSIEADRALLASLGLSSSALVARKAGDAHLQALCSRVREELAKRPDLALVLTGRAAAIQALRAQLKPDAPRIAKTKAYWALGKAGLD